MLNISIVLYHPDREQVQRLCSDLLRVECLHRLYLLDNSPEASSALAPADARCVYIYNEGENLGYGRAHNIALRESVYDGVAYHLVMNSDILVSAEDIDRLHAFMERNPQVGSLMPRVTYPDGRLQYLCKLLPTPLDVFGRRFLPKRWMAKRNARYELRAGGYNTMLNVPYLSGCFMFLRTQAALQAGLFDERYFMYPEDIDLTRTIHRNWLTLFLPDITIVHDHAQGSYKNMKLLWVHIVNMCRYFNKWGWFYDPERKLMNRLTLEQIDTNQPQYQ